MPKALWKPHECYYYIEQRSIPSITPTAFHSKRIHTHQTCVMVAHALRGGGDLVPPFWRTNSSHTINPLKSKLVLRCEPLKDPRPCLLCFVWHVKYMKKIKMFNYVPLWCQTILQGTCIACNVVKRLMRFWNISGNITLTHCRGFCVLVSAPLQPCMANTNEA